MFQMFSIISFLFKVATEFQKVEQAWTNLSGFICLPTVTSIINHSSISILNQLITASCSILRCNMIQLGWIVMSRKKCYFHSNSIIGSLLVAQHLQFWRLNKHKAPTKSKIWNFYSSSGPTSTHMAVVEFLVAFYNAPKFLLLKAMKNEQQQKGKK